MGDLTTKGIIARYGGKKPPFSVRHALSLSAGLHPLVSLRDALEFMATEEHSYKRGKKDEPFGWTAKYRQVWTHIVVRIRLKPKNDDVDDRIRALGARAKWKAAIERIFNKPQLPGGQPSPYRCGRQGELSCRFTFEAKFVLDDEHHKVKVVKLDEDHQTTMSLWAANDSGTTAAHEFGHMIGLYDEYLDRPAAPHRQPVDTRTLMDTNTSVIAPRHMSRFARNLGRQLEDDSTVRLAPF